MHAGNTRPLDSDGSVNTVNTPRVSQYIQPTTVIGSFFAFEPPSSAIDDGCPQKVAPAAAKKYVQFSRYYIRRRCSWVFALRKKRPFGIITIVAFEKPCLCRSARIRSARPTRTLARVRRLPPVRDTPVALGRRPAAASAVFSDCTLIIKKSDSF